ncbi:MAG: prolipoprotein diacylglyceryl transferase [Bacteroidota bacterium]|nr:prolipoprotein diacylglyceryl transferase [Bacteroidota bacterium]
MEKLKHFTGRILYGSLFVIVLPVLLMLWATFTNDIICLPVPDILYVGYLLTIGGFMLIALGMIHLWIYGNGLPMNAFPPKKYVVRGVYLFLKHPIYIGAIFMSFGLSILFNSSSGFWFISPLFVLMIIAYVAGFEREKTIQIFGKQEHLTFISLPPASDGSARWKDRLNVFLLVFLPWLVIYEAFIFIGVPKDFIATNLPIEAGWPVWEYTEVFYVFIYLYVVAIPFLLLTQRQIRSFMIESLIAIGIAFFIYMVFPFVCVYRDFIPKTGLGDLIINERAVDGQSAAFPSLHVIWAFMVSRYYAMRFERLKWGFYVIAVLISISCITTGNHSLLDVIAGFIVFIGAINFRPIWEVIRYGAEKIANSWHEWHIGPIRVINHGFYAGVGAFIGFLIIGNLLEVKYLSAAFIVCLLGIAGAGLWAQVIEGSPRLLRPYGYYGSVIGVLAGCVLADVTFGLKFIIILSTFAMAAPWIQMSGRLRCLVQGCCHGKPSDENIGIRFDHPKSRVLKIAGLKGMYIHPTQLYSIFTNFATGLVLFRLYSLQMSVAYIIGVYFILNGLGRFVEEAYRGEPQTPYWAGMRLYQWIAVLNIVMGAVFTTIPNNDILVFHFTPASLIFSVIIGVIVTIAYGVDFPSSNRRFARLTS